MNRVLLTLPVAGAVALAGTQLLGGETELPPEPVFPTVVNQTDQGWTDDGWSVNRFVDDPFAVGSTPDPFEVEVIVPDADSADPEAAADEASGSSGASPSPNAAPTTSQAPVTSTPATTTTPPPTTTARDLSQAPPDIADGGGVDLPEIDDLPGPDDVDGR